MTVQRYKKNRQNAIVVLNHVPPIAWRRTTCCVPTSRQLRRDVPPAASPRSLGGIGRPVTSCGGYLVDRRKGENVNVNVNLKCFSMLPEGEAYNRV